jgi:hypothetical protein
MPNNRNNDREQNWLLLSPRVTRAESDWRATVPLGVQDDQTRFCFIYVSWGRSLTERRNTAGRPV